MKLVITLLIVTLCASNTLQQNTDTDGFQAPVGSFPWSAFIQQRNWFQESCGGSVIAPNWVLTAASCKNANNNTVYRVFLGAVSWQYESLSEQILESNLFHLHPQFDGNSENRTNDIGLVELSTEIQFSPRVHAINLPWEYTDNSFAGQVLYIVAAVNLISGTGPNYNLRFNHVRVISDDDCDALSPGLRNESEMCTFVTEANPLQTPCRAEPGTVLARVANFGIWTIIGSGAVNSCGDTIPTTWNRVTEHLEWINEVTGLTANEN